MSDIRFSLIDETNIEDHTRLDLNDRCYFLFEYTPREGFTFSATNSLIHNLKKRPSIRHKPEYKHKVSAILRCSTLLREAFSAAFISTGTLVPVPPSKATDHPEYDDRMEQICRGIGQQADVRTLVRQTVSMEPTHFSGTGARHSVADLVSAYQIDETQTSPPPKSIAIVDDVLTAGTHFKAMQQVLGARFPGVIVFGIFIARRVLPVQDPSAFFGPVLGD